MKVKINFTHRGIPYEVEIEATGKKDIKRLLEEDLGAVIDSVHTFIEAVLDKNRIRYADP